MPGYYKKRAKPDSIAGPTGTRVPGYYEEQGVRSPRAPRVPHPIVLYYVERDLALQHCAGPRRGREVWSEAPALCAATRMLTRTSRINPPETRVLPSFTQPKRQSSRTELTHSREHAERPPVTDLTRAQSSHAKGVHPEATSARGRTYTHCTRRETLRVSLSPAVLTPTDSGGAR